MILTTSEAAEELRVTPFAVRKMVERGELVPVLTGSSPLSLSNQPLAFQQSCVSKRSIVGMGHGVCWAGPTGLCYVGQDGAKIITEGILTPEQWQELVPSTLVGSRFERYYIGFFDNT